ncbi:hypothetical protein FVE85_2128 [Porphyridium purpureum]|uniref:Uncharacterized protein n=1 Tax=Porphyridium purpureum TaxID=35688 RepID=A0A5J4YZC7_PORPP|nr:hypothetical protein FVE85_2128 [Porphyridium purpureum]|eukprot:POR3099..scf209_3
MSFLRIRRKWRIRHSETLRSDSENKESWRQRDNAQRQRGIKSREPRASGREFFCGMKVRRKIQRHGSCNVEVQDTMARPGFTDSEATDLIYPSPLHPNFSELPVAGCRPMLVLPDENFLARMMDFCDKMDAHMDLESPHALSRDEETDSFSLHDPSRPPASVSLCSSFDTACVSWSVPTRERDLTTSWAHPGQDNAASGNQVVLKVNRDGKARKRKTVRASTDRKPARFCHGCWRPARPNNRLIVCANYGGSSAASECRKVECERCVEDTVENCVGRECSHCAGKCGPKAQCAVYGETNKRRRLLSEQLRTIKASALTPHGQQSMCSGHSIDTGGDLSEVTTATV